MSFFSSFLSETISMSGQQSQTSVQRLITLERVQKLDLLIHLVSNLSQSLIICGPKGIGKTTILETLIEYKKDAWPICMIQGTSGLSFESILDKFYQQLTRLQSQEAGRSLSALLENYNKQNQKLVLILDDAGQLVPGLISSLIEFAHANGCLRVVLSLTHDELHIKNSSDRFIDDCHLIEVPPLTKKQCMLFLQNQSAQPGSVISFNAVTDSFVDSVYRQTHGIPGRIVAELPKITNDQSTAGLKWGMGALIIFAAFSAGLLFYFYQPDVQKPESLEVNPLLKKKVVAVEISSPWLQSEKEEQIDSENKANQKPKNNTNDIAVVDDGASVLPNNEKKTEMDKTKLQREKEETLEIVKAAGVVVTPPVEVQEKLRIPPAGLTVNHQSEKTVVEEKREKVAVELTHSPKTGKNGSDVMAWVKSQSADLYTIQLMVLSQRQSAEKLLKKYPTYKGEFKYFRIKKQGQNKYVVIYGSFKNLAEAVKAKRRLPVAFRKGWVRKFKVLQEQM